MATRKKPSQSTTSQKKSEKKGSVVARITKTTRKTSTRKPKQSVHCSKDSRVVPFDRTGQENEKTWEEEQESWMESVLDTVRDAIITLDEKQHIVLFNKGAEEMFLCPSFQAIGMTIDQFIPPRLRTIHHEYVQQFMKSEVTVRATKTLGELFGLRTNGEEFPIEASISQYGLRGKTLLTLIFRDITERREAQNAWEKERQFISTILDTADALVVVLDPQWRIVRFNRVCEQLTGRTIGEMRGKSFLNLSVVSGEDALEVKSLLLSFKKGGEFPKSFESVWVDIDRKLHWIAWSNTIVSDKEGKIENIIATGVDVTIRKQAEQALSKEQEFISAVLDTAGALIVVLDRQGKIIRFNRACEELTGYSFVDIQGKRLWDFLLLPEESPAVKKVFQNLREETRSNQFENHWVTKDGKIRQISWSNTILANNKGKVDYVIGIGIDVTERRQAEQDIQNLLRHNSLILNSAGEGIYGLDLHGNTTFVNPAAEKMLGYDAQELLGMPMHATIHHSKSDGSLYPLEICPIYEAFKDGKVRRAEEVLWCKDGTSLLVEYTITPILGDRRKIEGAVVIFTDISDRKKTEEAIRESEELFQAFMNHSPAVKFLKDGQGRYVFVNQQFEEKLRLSKADCLGKTDMQLFPPEVSRIFKEHDLEVLETGNVLETEETTLGERGNLCYWWVMKFPVYRTDGEVQLGGVALDITSLKKVEETLRLREAELQRSQELLQALGGALITAHEDERRRISRELHDDMNQRLAILALNIQSSQKGFSQSLPIYQTLQKLYDGVSTLSDDVRHLAYQLHPSILDDLGLKVALQSFLDDFSKWEGILVTFTSTDLPISLPQSIASCLYRVTQECLRNVARYAQATQAEVKLIEEDGGLRLSITDNGKGFNVEEIRTEKHGLGLIGMRERVRVVQGTYELKSTPGQGTEIRVWVPIKEVESEKRKG